AAVYNKAPVRDMVRRGWIPSTKNADTLAENVCKFLRIKHIEDDPQLSWAARKADAYAPTSNVQAAWCFRAKELAECAPAGRFQANQF
ncbi:hypothetical protein L9G74_20990, partial [Shewanella sp. C32]